MRSWTFSTNIYASKDALLRLTRFAGERIVIVCDPFLKGTSGLAYVLDLLQNNNHVAIYSNVVPDPPIEAVADGVNFMKQEQPDIVIAIGGGSAIDLAKAVLYFYRKVNSKPIKNMTAIPTTSGTGSEVTSFAVITDTVSKVKYPLLDDSLLPDEAILTPLFVKTAPPKVTAYSGMDVLVHAIEALVSTGADSFTDALAEKAIEYVFTYLPRCYVKSAGEEDRMRMHEASCMAGLAFNKAGLGITHALAHQLGALYHIPHGLANAMLLSRVIAFNALRSGQALKKYADIARKMHFCVSTAEDKEALIALIKQIMTLARTLDCPLTVKEATGQSAEETRQDIPLMADRAIKDRTYSTNPYPATIDDLAQLLLTVM